MEKLLSITNLKKYFPLAKSSIFAKQVYNRANEDITLDIYQGETFGLVGESGCGKSTLGRVLLQLYDQTAGTTMYYGATLANVAPSYVTDTLKNAEKYVNAYKKAQARADELAKKCETLGDKATFYNLQEKNLAASEAQTLLAQSAKILGGFMVRDTKKGAEMKLAKYRQICRAEQLRQQIEQIELEISVQESIAEEQPKRAQACQKKIAKLREKTAELTQKRDACGETVGKEQIAIDALKAKYAGDEEFAAYEAMKAHMKENRENLELLKKK